MHTNDARKHGESDEWMHLLNAWHEAPIRGNRDQCLEPRRDRVSSHASLEERETRSLMDRRNCLGAIRKLVPRRGFEPPTHALRKS